MRKLADDLDRFKNMWLSNPGAQLDFARLIERCIELGDDDGYHQVRGWVQEEKRAAASIGIR